MVENCPDPEALRRLVLGQAAAAEAAALQGHLGRCERCRRLVGPTQYGDDLATEVGGPLPPPPHQPSAEAARLLRQLEAATPTPAAEDYRFLSPAQAAGEIGRLGNYRVLGVLGRGGMGLVFRAEDAVLGRPVALKVMRLGLEASATARRRFLREARSAAAVRHERLVAVYQVGEDNGAPFLAMELLEGETLEDRLRREGKLPVAEALRLAAEAAEGLAAAHEHGLIHRDVKPANLWLEAARPGATPHVKVLDFGLARSGQDEVRLTRSGAVVGTPAFMAPEQARALPVDARADLFSLGCVLYVMLTGRQPFRADDLMSLLAALALDEPPPPQSLEPGVPQAAGALVMRLLAKAPAERPASAQVVAEELRGLLRQAERGGGRPAPRRRVVLVLLAAAVLGAAALGAWVMMRDRGREPPVEAPGERRLAPGEGGR